MNGQEEPSLEKVIEEISLKHSNLKQFLVEAGVTTTAKYYTEEGRTDVTKNPIDTLVLNVMIDGEVSFLTLEPTARLCWASISLLRCSRGQFQAHQENCYLSGRNRPFLDDHNLEEEISCWNEKTKIHSWPWSDSQTTRIGEVVGWVPKAARVRR